MTKRLIMPIVLIGLMGLNVAGCGGDESKKDSVKTTEVPAKATQVPAKITEVPAADGAQLKRTLLLNKYKMIEFGGRHCIPCKNMQPILLELIQSHGDSVAIVNVYVQEQLQLGRESSHCVISQRIVLMNLSRLLRIFMRAL